eukprot:TRINITY_DN39872_c0_g1_i1.p1 TRINITY_DN39872_c0_g1~~TRINITY_DN39872_c0_g1_i1.p1  ORF type:complete len:1276 (+),score=203.55 TRINITY_DN39872_c0_g1_i1:410-3829(+)
MAILYQQRKFILNNATNTFERLKFCTTHSVAKYLKSTGFDDGSAAKVFSRYGQNNFDIPLPTFSELFKEHAVAPFFVFQMLCVTLWLMDDYWYYSLVTLVMLIILECQMVTRRLHDLSELRAMRIPSRQMTVYRGGVWKHISSDMLLPGDIVALGRGNKEQNCPCDVLLLQGNALVNEAMLTGESVPQMKVALSCGLDSEEAQRPLEMKGRHKQHVVSAGTNIMLHENEEPSKVFKKVPGNGCVGYVLRTGFDTTQGKLVRTILFSAERVTVSSREALLFLCILVVFAILASIYVLFDGLVWSPEEVARLMAELEASNRTICANNTSANGTNVSTEDTSNASSVNGSNTTDDCVPPFDPPRSVFKLLLSVSHILTSVVPPEFPITLSLAVNLSLVALVKHKVFCTEPFRVPLAGKVSTCCFDKTGTLTSDAMEVDRIEGVEQIAVGKPNADPEVISGDLDQALPFLSTAVIAACHGLTVIEGQIVGDPLEKAALNAIGWQLPGSGLVVSKPGKGADRLQILHRHPFVSEFQRMSVLVKHTGPGRGYLGISDEVDKTPAKTDKLEEHCRVLALVKGSCEVLKPRLREVPSNFDALQEKLSKQGLRVLCLAAKDMPDTYLRSDARDVSREMLESDLDFCGMLVLRNAIKANSVQVIKHLRRSYHRVTMITGDNPLTACQVALDVGMTERPFLILEQVTSEGDASDDATAVAPPTLVWKSRDHSSNGAQTFDVAHVSKLAKSNALCIPGAALAHLTDEQVEHCATFITVFARVAPQQKQQVILAINQSSGTMMVGDGTNDVGALKHAHVGVSLLSSIPEIQDAVNHTRQRAVASTGGGGRRQVNIEDFDDSRAPLVRLGDASIASPFTHKGDTVKCCTQILRCGRATLSTVLMMYKIMGINSVLSAFAMSALTLDGVKLGDGQTAVESLFITSCFFLISRSSPAKKLAKQHPINSIFHWSVMLSLALQLTVHLIVLVVGWRLATSSRPTNFRRELGGDFTPNLTNTVVFELTAAMHISTFLANYEGHPFMQPFTTNRPLLYGTVIFIATIFLCASEAVPDVNELLSLVPSPSEDFRNKILALLAADIICSVTFARSINAYAVWSRGRSAEQRARELGLGFQESDDEAETAPKSKKKKKKKEQ